MEPRRQTNANSLSQTGRDANPRGLLAAYEASEIGICLEKIVLLFLPLDSDVTPMPDATS